jgi:hypothetical protein
VQENRVFVRAVTPAAFAAHLRRIANEIERSEFMADRPHIVQAAGDDTLVIVGFHFKQGGCGFRDCINLPNKKG